jgi:hypothetical protein
LYTFLIFHMHSTCTVHLIPFEWIIQIMFIEGYKLRNFSLGMKCDWYRYISRLPAPCTLTDVSWSVSVPPG